MTEEIKDTEVAETPDTPEEVKTFTQEELDDIVQKRLARERTKAREDYKKELEEEKKKAERLAELSAEERAKEIAREKERELEEARATIQRMNLEQDTISRLNDEGISHKFKDFLMGADAESTNENIKAFKEVFDEMVQEEVEKRFKGRTPTIGTTPTPEKKKSGIREYAKSQRLI